MTWIHPLALLPFLLVGALVAAHTAISLAALRIMHRCTWCHRARTGPSLCDYHRKHSVALIEVCEECGTRRSVVEPCVCGAPRWGKPVEVNWVRRLRWSEVLFIVLVCVAILHLFFSVARRLM